MLKLEKALCCAAFAAALLLQGCGFHLPSEATLAETIPVINFTGDERGPFGRSVIKKLRTAGVDVRTSKSKDHPLSKDPAVPQLQLAGPSVSAPLVSVNSYLSATEYNMILNASGILRIQGHRPILMRASITRSYLNKTGAALATSIEFDNIYKESCEELATQIVTRLGYLGRQSDPNDKAPTPAELTVSADDPSTQLKDEPVAGMTLMEALRYQGEQEKQSGKSTTLDQLNNGSAVLKGTHDLPKTKPVLKNEAPESVSAEGF
jgi:outer membrane lipopolysaccharide assembly protein LptE/RlpB